MSARRHGFDSRRGRWGSVGTVRKSAGRPGSNPGACGFKSHQCYPSNASAGHRRAQVAVTHPPGGIAGSTPARRTLLRPWPVRLSAQDTGFSRRRGGFDSRTGCSGRLRFPGVAGAWRALMRPACPVRSRGLGLREGRCSAESHKLRLMWFDSHSRNSPPSPGRQTGRAAGSRTRCLRVRIPPRRLIRPVPSRRLAAKAPAPHAG